MANEIKRFFTEEEGMGVIEIVIIIAVLVSLALLFRKRIGTYANNLMDHFFKTDGLEAPNQALPN